MRMIKRIFLTLFFPGLIVLGFIWHYSDYAVVPKRQNIPVVKPGGFKLSYDAYFCLTPGMRKIHVCFFQCDHPRGTVILLHGLGANKNQLMPMVPALCAAGFNVFLLDFRGHGLSDGDETTMGYREIWELKEAIREIKTVEKDPRAHLRVGIYGISLGAAVALLACPDLPVMAVAVDECYASAYNVARNLIRKNVRMPELIYPCIIRVAEWRIGVSYSKINPLSAALNRYRGALMVVEAGKNSVVPQSDAERIYRAFKGSRKILVSIPDVNRNVINDEEYIQTVVSFFENNLLHMSLEQLQIKSGRDSK